MPTTAAATGCAAVLAALADRESETLWVVAVAVATIVVAVGLLRWSRVLKVRRRRGAGLAIFAGLVYIPAAGGYLASWIRGTHAFFVEQPDKRTVLEPTVLSKILLTVLFVAGLYILTELVDLFLFSREREKATGWKVPRILRDSIRWLLLLGALFFVLVGTWKVEFKDVSIIAGAITLVLGIGLGPTLGSLVAGVALTSERPFELGDWIEVEDKQGRVDQITWRSTRIITRDNVSIVYPNAKLADQRILNLSRPDPRLGVRCHVGVHYRTPPLETREALRKAVRGTPGVLSFPDPAIRLLRYGDSSIDWEIRFWIDDAEKVEEIKADVMQRIWYSFQRAGIEIPYPIRNLLMREKEWDAPPRLSETQRQQRIGRNKDLLKSVPIFGPLPDEDLSYLATRAPEEVFLDGERVALEGEPGDRMFIIVRGHARVTVNVDGVQELGELVPGEFFGEMSLLTGSPRVASVTAVGELATLTLRASDLSPVLQKHPEFAKDMANFAAARKVQLEDTTKKIREERSSKDFETTSSNLLADIMRFFKLQGPKEHGKSP